ncbi:hypothetical protein [Treponema zioleckii]|uniref:hypothetical protein n=1 Tax=Treponema zioleckii TaxID=331680 RepID=UPI00168AB13F|nr:hypothetical protein [Treponema zioleckii]
MKNTLSTPVKFFLASEILIFLIVAVSILHGFIFPPSEAVQLEMFFHYQKWSPRVWDNIAEIFYTIGSILVFVLSAFGITALIKKYACNALSEIIEIVPLPFCFVLYIKYPMPIIIPVFIISLLALIASARKLFKAKAAPKEKFMYFVMIINLLFFGYFGFYGFLYHFTGSFYYWS